VVLIMIVVFIVAAAPIPVTPLIFFRQMLIVNMSVPVVLGHPLVVVNVFPRVGIELRRAGCRWRVTTLALSIASWVLISTMATFSEAPL
jgi:hypothetical protein